MQSSRCLALTRNVRTAYRQSVRCISDKNNDGEKYIPSAGTARSATSQLKEEFKSLFMDTKLPDMDLPRSSDVVIIGGGLVGSCVAYFLKNKYVHGHTVTVVERDFGYTQASSMLSVGGVRHQFSQPQNVQMSMFTSEFLKNIKEHLSVLDQDPPEVQFHHHGYLFLAPEDRVDYLQDCVHMQRQEGAKTAFLTKPLLAEKFPWLNLDGIEAGSYGTEGEGWFDPYQLVHALRAKNMDLGVNYVQGTEGEGWFDPYQLVRALRAKNMDLGVNYVQGEVTQFRYTPNRERLHIQGVDIKVPSGDTIGCDGAAFINCAGPWAGQISDMAGVGTGELNNTAKLPVEPRKRYVYCFHCPDGPTLDTPLTVDPTGVYFRREGLGGHYLCGASPVNEDDEPDIGNLDVDYDFFYDYIWPTLAKRVPAFENSKLKSAWAGFYDYNVLDQNLIIGRHTYHKNLIFANGMSGHGVQQALAIGRAVSELFVYEEFQTIDLTDFSFSRVEFDNPIQEQAIV